MLLKIDNLNAGYGFLQVLRDVSLKIDKAEYVSLIGPNGAGKSTTLKTIAGIIKPMSGQILFDGQDIGGLSGNKVTRLGISFISEEMNLFTNMTVRENMMMGAYTIREKTAKNRLLNFAYALFPRLEERQNQLAGTLSGGERKMLGIGRALMADPKLLLVDEPSFGLAPQLTDQVFDSLNTLRKEGKTILVVEQNVTKALSMTDRGYVLENGRIDLEGPSEELADNAHVRKVFLGV